MTTAERLEQFRDCEAALRNRDLEQALYDAGKVVMDGVLLTLHGQDHADRREVEVRVFRRNFFKYYEKQVFPDTLAQTLAPYLDQRGGNLVEIGYRLTVNLTADFAGVDRPLKSVAETADLIRITKKLSEGATMVHSTRDPDELNAEVQQALEELDARFLTPSIMRRRELMERADHGEISRDDLPRDVLTVLLQAEHELNFDEAQRLREIAFYLQAGSHSTANSVVHALEEVLAWAGNDDGRWARLDDPVFVQHCVHESLRLHPASPEAWRKSTCPVHFESRGTLETGSRVELDLFTANRDKTIFGEDADLFNPDRVVPNGVLRSGLAFGIGLHTCLGRELDGGVVAKPGSAPEICQFGIVPLIVIELLRLGARKVEGDPPVPDTTTSRPNYSDYPIVFTKVEA
ncbi:MAG: cytochrome P450 [Sphingomonadaceae bacterium]